MKQIPCGVHFIRVIRVISVQKKNIKCIVFLRASRNELSKSNHFIFVVWTQIAQIARILFCKILRFAWGIVSTDHEYHEEKQFNPCNQLIIFFCQRDSTETDSLRSAKIDVLMFWSSEVLMKQFPLRSEKISIIRVITLIKNLCALCAFAWDKKIIPHTESTKFTECVHPHGARVKQIAILCIPCFLCANKYA